jgi:kynurenine 3-monooxygenase
MSQTIVIIGAGPAGLLLAHYLVRRNDYRVEIYERRSDPRAANVSADRTFPISLQERGRKAIRAIAGLEDAIAAQSTMCQGTVVYRTHRKPRRLSRKTPVLSIDRNRLVTILLQQLATPDVADRLSIHFNCTCLDIDGVAKTVTLQPDSGEPFTTHYDVLIGADGARSQVRDYLVNTHQLQCEQHYISDEYKSVLINRRNPELGLEVESNKIHTWNLDNKTRMILVPQPGDRLSGTLIFNAQANPLESLSTKEEILAFFQTKFPIAGQLMTLDDADAILNRPIAKVLTVTCDRFHGNQILLLGDAAHAVSPSIGQGCNASLEDVLILNDLLDQYGDDWSQVLPAFSQQRIPDAHALQDLSTYSFPRTKALVIEFFLRLTLTRFLRRWFPNWVNPFVFDLVLETDLPYSQVLSLNRNWIDKVRRSQHTV